MLGNLDYAAEQTMYKINKIKIFPILEAKLAHLPTIEGKNIDTWKTNDFESNAPAPLWDKYFHLSISISSSPSDKVYCLEDPK